MPAQVYVWVSGGIADYEVTRGDVEVIQIDWDNIDDKYAEPELDDLEALRPELERIADENVRNGALRRLDEAISNLRYHLEVQSEAEVARREARIDEARKVLKEAGEL